MTDIDSEKNPLPVDDASPDRDERRRNARAAAKALPYADPVLPRGPYFVGDGDDLTPAGEELILKSVMAGNTQDLVGKQLGIAPIQFAKKINRHGSPLYNAWRLANAELDSEYMRRQTYRALVLRSPDAIAFGLRQRGYSEKTAPSAVVNVDVGNKIQLVPPGTSYEEFESFAREKRAEGKMVLGASHTKESYLLKVGQDEIKPSSVAQERVAAMKELPPPLPIPERFK